MILFYLLFIYYLFLHIQLYNYGGKAVLINSQQLLLIAVHCPM